MKCIVKAYDDENTDFIFPCLLQHVSDHLELNQINDIILALRSGGDFIVGIVMTNFNELSHFRVGETIERTFLKKNFRPFYGEIVISN